MPCSRSSARLTATPQERVRLRSERSRPLVIALEAWLRVLHRMRTFLLICDARRRNIIERANETKLAPGRFSRGSSQVEVDYGMEQRARAPQKPLQPGPSRRGSLPKRHAGRHRACGIVCNGTEVSCFESGRSRACQYAFRRAREFRGRYQ